MSKLGRVVAVLCGVLLLLQGAVALAAPPAKPRGLPALNVAALVASEAALFVAGFDEGLYIVDRAGDAHAFEDPALSRHINALAWSERERTLWLGTARGLTRCRLAAPTSCTRLGPSRAVHALLLRSDGSVVAGGDAGLTFSTASSTRTIGKKQAAPYRSVWALAESPDGTLFVGATNGLFWAGSAAIASGDAELRRASLVTGDLPDDWVTALLLRGDELHVGTYNAGIASFTFDAGQLRSTGVDPGAGYVNPAGLFGLGNGVLAVATMTGLRLGAPPQTTVVSTRARDVTALAPAHTGGYWIGTRQGLEWTSLAQRP
jgi:ligand-binding sensor domain-containing protein